MSVRITYHETGKVLVQVLGDSGQSSWFSAEDWATFLAEAPTQQPEMSERVEHNIYALGPIDIPADMWSTLLKGLGLEVRA